MSLPMDAAKRKTIPLATGCLDYFPDALAAVADLSRVGGEQHNPGQPLFWDRTKSTDHGDALMRHFLERGGLDIDGVRHSAKVAWRALALLQTELEGAENNLVPVLKITPHWHLDWGPGRYTECSGSVTSPHPMNAEALRDEFQRDDQGTGV